MNGVLPDGLSVTDNGDGTATISGTARHLTSSPVTLSVQANNAAGSVTSPLAVSVPSAKGWLAGSDGAVYPVGRDLIRVHAGLQAQQSGAGLAATPDGDGYWLVASDGGVFNYGDAGFDGSRGGQPLNAPIVGMAATPDGGGYWLVASDGGVFNYGDAGFYGSVASGGSGSLVAPVVGISSSADGRGYSLATSSGDVVPFGDGVAGGGLTGVRALDRRDLKPIDSWPQRPVPCAIPLARASRYPRPYRRSGSR